MVVDYHRFKIVYGCLCKDYKMYGGSFLYHVGGDGQSLVSLGLVVSHFLSFLTTTIPVHGLSSRTVWVRRYEKGKTSLNLSEARDDGVKGWQWHQLDYMQTVYTSLHTKPNQHLIAEFLHAGCSSWCPTISVKALTTEKYISTGSSNTFFHYVKK